MAAGKDGRSGGGPRQAPAARQAAAQAVPRKSLPEAPAPGEEQTSWPAFGENPHWLPNPERAEIVIRENESVENPQIIENIS